METDERKPLERVDRIRGENPVPAAGCFTKTQDQLRTFSQGLALQPTATRSATPSIDTFGPMRAPSGRAEMCKSFDGIKKRQGSRTCGGADHRRLEEILVDPLVAVILRAGELADLRCSPEFGEKKLLVVVLN